jgi:hypothetical protein
MEELPKQTKRIRATDYQVVFRKKTIQRLGWEKGTSIKFQFPSKKKQPVAVSVEQHGYTIMASAKGVYYLNAKEIVSALKQHFGDAPMFIQQAESGEINIVTHT